MADFPVVLFVGLRGNSHEYLAAIEAAHRQGSGVVLLGSAPAKTPHGLCSVYKADLSDITDLNATIDEIASAWSIKGVVTWSDSGVEAASRAASRLGLPGPRLEAAQITRNKFLMRTALMDRPELIPKFARVRSWQDALAAVEKVGFPAVLKPTSASGSKGIFLLKKREDLHPAFESLIDLTQPTTNKIFKDNPGELIYEEFMEGTEHSVEGLIHRGEVYIAGVTDKQTTEPFRLELAHLHPSSLGDKMISKIENLTRTVLEIVGLDDCAFHLECMVGPQGVRLVEVAARAGGDFIGSHLVGLASGVSFSENVIRVAVGLPPLLPEKQGIYAGCRKVIASSDGWLAELSGLMAALSVPGVQHLSIECDIGKRVILPPDHYSSCVLGTIIATGGSSAAVLEALAAASLAITAVVSEKSEMGR